MYVHAIAWVVTAAMAASAAGATPAAPDPPLALGVALTTVAPVPAPLVRQAQNDVRRIFRSAGVDIVWIDPDAAPPKPSAVSRIVSVVVLPRAAGAAADGDAEPMGVTILTRGRPMSAYVFFDRVVRNADALAVAVPLVMAGVIAHELTHLVVGADAHAPAGLMRAQWGRTELVAAAQGQLRFSPAESRAIRGSLIAPAAVLTARAGASPAVSR